MSAADLAAIREALLRVQGIADADRGLMLGEYGFKTIKDALFDARMALDRIEQNTLTPEQERMAGDTGEAT